MDGPDAHGLTGISSVPDRKDTTKGTAVKETTFHRTRKRHMGVEVHDCELEWFAEIPDDWYDDIDDEEEDGCEDECDCVNCERHGDCEYEELRGMTIVMPDLEGREEECKDADEIRSQFISWMNSVFFTEHPLPMFRFQQWYLLRHTSASYWIENQDSMFDMFFMADSIAEWRSEGKTAVWVMGED